MECIEEPEFRIMLGGVEGLVGQCYGIALVTSGKLDRVCKSIYCINGNAKVRKKKEEEEELLLYA